MRKYSVLPLTYLPGREMGLAPNVIKQDRQILEAMRGSARAAAAAIGLLHHPSSSSSPFR